MLTFPGHPVGIATRAQGGGYTTEAQALFARWASAGASPSTALARRSDALIRALQVAGVWSKLDMLKLLDPHSTLTPGLLDWKNAAYDGSLVGAGTFTQNAGWAGNGSTGYINTGFNPSTAGGQYSRDSAYFGIWSNTSSVQAGSVAGYYDGSKGVSVNPRASGDGLSIRINQSSVLASLGGTVIDGSGLFGAARSGASSDSARRNGVEIVAGTTASAAVANGSFRLGNFGTATYSTLQFRAAIAGGYLSIVEEVALHSAIATFLEGI